jgi:hypothetical protein
MGDVEFKNGRYYSEPVLDRAESRGVISRSQWSAGDKYRLHWYRSGLHGQVSAQDLGRLRVSDYPNFDGMAKTESQVFHRGQLQSANDRLGEYRNDVIRVVCLDWSLEQIGTAHGFSNRPQAVAAGIMQLRCGLNVLSRLWGT